MSDVKRYHCYGKDELGYQYDALFREETDGDWVLFSDYAALKAQRDNLLASQQSGMEYSIKPQRMIEAARRRELPLPSPELHHHKMLTDVLEELAALKARLAEATKANAEVNAQCMKEAARADNAEARLAEAIAALAGVLPEGIEGSCDECGGDETQCPKDCCIRIGKGVLLRAADSEGKP